MYFFFVIKSPCCGGGGDKYTCITTYYCILGIGIHQLWDWDTNFILFFTDTGVLMQIFSQSISFLLIFEFANKSYL